MSTTVLPCDPIQLSLDVDRLWPAAARARGVDPSRHFGCVFGGFTGASVDMNGELWTSAPGGYRIVGRPFDGALEDLARELEDVGYDVERTRNRWRVLGWAASTVLARGCVVRAARPDHTQAGIVLRPHPRMADAVEVVHGWIDNPPDAGTFTLTFQAWRRGAWQLAAPEDEATIRELFLEHARGWSSKSKAWVANEQPAPVRLIDLAPSHPANEERTTRLLADRQRRDADAAPASDPKFDHARGLR